MKPDILSGSNTTASAIRIFTDRDEPRNSFRRNYEKMKKQISDGELPDLRVLTYYGMDGIGKSRLLEKLQEELTGYDPDARYIRHIFTKGETNKSEILLYLRLRAGERLGIKFPHFDYIYNVYCRKTNKNPITEKQQKSGLCSSAVDMASLIPFLGDAVQFANSAIGFAGAAKNMIDANRMKDNRIENADPSELYAEMHIHFIKDMTSAAQQFTSPLVIFLDSYENFVNETERAEHTENDSWIWKPGGLIECIPNVIWVIGAREKLKWEEYAEEYSEILEQHQLKSFSKADSINNFLARRSIESLELREELFALTQGIPLYLDICAQTYESMVKHGRTPTIEDFGRTPAGLISNLISDMDSQHQDIIFMLSVLEQWNDEIVIEVAKKCPFSFSASVYETVKGYSFISSPEKGEFVMHSVVADAILENCADKMKNITEPVMDAMYDYSDALSSEGRYFEALRIKARLFELNRRIEENRIPGLSFPPDRSLFAARDYAVMLHYVGQFGKALRIEEEALEKSRKAGEFYETITLMNNMTDSLRNLGRFKESYDLSRQVYEMYVNTYGESHRGTIEALSNLARAMDDAGDTESAYKYGKAALEKTLRLNGGRESETTLMMRNNLLSYMMRFNQYEEAYSMGVQLLRLKEQILTEEHPDLLWTKVIIEEALLYLGKYEEAADLGNEIIEECPKKLGEVSQIMLKSLKITAYAYQFIGELETAAELFKKAIDINIQAGGETHPDTAAMLTNYIGLMLALGNHHGLTQTAEKAYTLCRGAFGDDNELTVRAVGNYAFTLYEEHDERAPETVRYAFEKCLEKFGMDDPLTIEIRNKYNTLQ